MVVLAMLAGQALASEPTCDARFDAVLRARAHAPSGVSQVIVRLSTDDDLSVQVRALGGSPIRRMTSLRILVATIPDRALHALSGLRGVQSISLDRRVHGAVDATGASIGAQWVRQELGFDGKGIGIALIDSGVTASHDDLDADRVVHFADFVNLRPGHYDDYGHGTHVAGIIAGNGRESGGARVGVAPGSSLIVLKALDGAGFGYSSNVIAALEYAIAHREKFNIRVINLSVAAGVFESYNKDPLTLAAKRAVDAGIVVVAAAGNLGRNNFGKTQYGGISAPGNAPWVLTVGASNGKGTTDRSDDEIAAFSSRGPSAIDRSAKPDLVAPGVGIESITEPASVLFAAHPKARLWGTTRTISQPYLSLSGTSMASPVVAGTVALMLQANPALTPNAVKAILQFTAERRGEYDHRTQGAGFLNARGAVELARHFKDGFDPRRVSQERTGDPVRWSRQIIWGRRLLSDGPITPGANAWQRGVVWGAMTTPSGDAVVWSDGAAKSPAGNVELLDAGADEASYAEAWIAASAEYAEQDLVLAGSYFETLDAAAALEQLRRELPAVNSGWPADLFGAIESRKRSAGSPRERRIR
jgi:serine protease AprX